MKAVYVDACIFQWIIFCQLLYTIKDTDIVVNSDLLATLFEDLNDEIADVNYPCVFNSEIYHPNISNL